MPWIDLSTGINPWPYPVPRLPSDVWARLPEPDDVRALEAAARCTYHAPNRARLMAVPGTDVVINLLPRLVAPAAQVAVVGPTYASHARAWASAGHHVRAVEHVDAIANADIAIVVNPNNPDGRAIAPDVLHAAATRLAANGGFLMIDEAFADAASNLSILAPEADLDHVVVLRSFGKFYGLAGVRLGFVASSHPIATSLADALGDWPISGPAIVIGLAALADANWAAATRERLARTAARLTATLANAGFTDDGGTDLFRLGGHRNARAEFVNLARYGILVRPFQSRAALRFGLPPDDAAFDRLAAALGHRSPPDGLVTATTNAV